jgi:hypothetical protein
MKKRQIKIGERFGRCTISKDTLGILVINAKGQRMVFIKCDCGKKKVVSVRDLWYGGTKSCGCLRDEKSSKRWTHHGQWGTRIHHIWIGMIQRTTNKKSPAYKNYGGRGITVCKRWRKFENFFADMKKGYRKNLSIDRINNDKGYSPKNCRWATRKQQNNNTRKTRK